MIKLPEKKKSSGKQLDDELLQQMLMNGDNTKGMFEPDENATGEVTKSFVETAKICFQNNDDPQKLKALLDVTGTPSTITKDNIVVFKMNEWAKGMCKDNGVVYTIKIDEPSKVAEDFNKYCDQNDGVYKDNGVFAFDGYGLKMQTNLDGTINIIVVEADQ